MKKKIVSLLLIFVLLFTNYAFAYERETGTLLKRVANFIRDGVTIGADYTATTSEHSQNYNNKEYTSKLGDYSVVLSGSVAMANEATVYSSNNKKVYLSEVEDGNESDLYVNRYITLKLDNNSGNQINFTQDEFYIVYYNAVSYNGNKYNIKLQVNSIKRDAANNGNEEIYFQVGRYKKNNHDSVDFDPGIGTSATDGHTEVAVSYLIQDNQGNNIPVEGLFYVSDLDLQQGFAVENNKITTDNVYMWDDENAKNTIYYYTTNEVANNTTYIYSNTDENLDDKSTVYMLINKLSNINFTFTFDKLEAYSNIGFCTDIPTKCKVETEVINGTISPTTEVNKGENVKVTYSPKDETYYLKKITIDGQEQSSLTDIKNEYTFPEVHENRKIKVEYAKKLTVQFNSKGGTAVPTQYVIPSEKATEPAQPTYNGYTFKGWYIDENYTTLYNFNNPVNEDKILYAKWEKNDVYHNITYTIVGTPKDNNATNNPTKYKEGDTTPLTISDPTKDNYTFSGWYENSELTGNPVTTLNVSNRKTDIALYGKWTKNQAQYTVKHYLEDENGTITKDGKKYKLSNSETKNAESGATVTESAKTYVGYNALDTTLSGVVKDDGTLVLNFYYDKIQYTVTFDTKGGTPVPNQQTKKFGEKVTKPTDPTKNGYDFLYWYEIVNGVEVQYDFNTPVTSNKTLIAKWQEVVPVDVYHNIYYRIDGELDNSAGNPERFKEGSTTPLTIYNPTKHGYTFSGWYNNQGLTGDKITTLNVSDKKADITLYGKWTKNKEPYSNYTVNHYLEDEDGKVTVDGKKYTLNNTKTKSAETDSTVTEHAQTFEGYEAQKYSLSGVVTEDGSLVLNFYYNKKQYNITFDSKGGTEVKDQTKIYGEKVDKPQNPTKEGYKFLYWYEEKDGKKVIYDFDTPVNSDKKLIAEWEENKIVPDQKDTEKQVPAQKTDTTTATKVLPNTGIGTAIIVAIILLAGAIFGIRYFKLKNDMK